MTDLALFREETRDWLETNCPPEMKKPMTPHGMTWGGRNCKFSHTDQELWLKRLGEKGKYKTRQHLSSHDKRKTGCAKNYRIRRFWT